MEKENLGKCELTSEEEIFKCNVILIGHIVQSSGLHIGRWETWLKKLYILKQFKLVLIQANSPVVGSRVEVWDRSVKSCSLNTPICPGHLPQCLQGPVQGNAGAITAAGRIPMVLLKIEEESPSLGYALQGLRYPQVRAVSLLTQGHHLSDSCLAFEMEAHPLVLFFSQKPPGPILPPYSGLYQDFY